MSRSIVLKLLIPSVKTVANSKMKIKVGKSDDSYYPNSTIFLLNMLRDRTAAFTSQAIGNRMMKGKFAAVL